LFQDCIQIFRGVAFHFGLRRSATWVMEVVWVGCYVPVVWCVVPSDYAFVLFDYCVAVFLERGVVVDVECVAFG